MKKIQNETYYHERSLYNIKDYFLNHVSFTSKSLEGESPLKECENITLNECLFDLRYPLWHNKKLKINNTSFSETSRAALWYCNDVYLENSTLEGVKAFRECKNIKIENCNISSSEFMWRCSNIELNSSNVSTEYGFFESKNIKLKNVNYDGKYSFQYVNKLNIEGSKLKTKDAFWHAKNVVVKDSILEGEYLGWYSENVIFINCEIISHQPLCYAKNLTLVNCKMDKCDLAFEYSEVNADIASSIISIKNPLSGEIKVEKIQQVVNEESKYESKAKIKIKGNK